jgi:hypothetical protein
VLRDAADVVVVAREEALLAVETFAALEHA